MMGVKDCSSNNRFVWDAPIRYAPHKLAIPSAM